MDKLRGKLSLYKFASFELTITSHTLELFPVAAFDVYVADEDSSVDGNDEEDTKDTNGGDPNGAMTCKQFSAFASDAGFLGGDQKIRRFSVMNIGRKGSVISKGKDENKVGVTLKDIRQIFAASQHHLEPTEKKAVEEGDDIVHHHELMGRSIVHAVEYSLLNEVITQIFHFLAIVFSEFLEAVARLGVLKYQEDKTKGDGEKLSYYECIKLGIEGACSVVG